MAAFLNYRAGKYLRKQNYLCDLEGGQEPRVSTDTVQRVLREL